MIIDYIGDLSARDDLEKTDKHHKYSRSRNYQIGDRIRRGYARDEGKSNFTDKDIAESGLVDREAL